MITVSPPEPQRPRDPAQAAHPARLPAQPPALPGPPAGVLMLPDADHRPRSQAGDRLHQLFERRREVLAASGRAGHPAVIEDAQSMSYAELDACANRLARRLLRLGVRPGDRLALLLDKGRWSYAAMLAVGKLECAYVPMDPAFPADRIAFIAQDAGVVRLLSLARLRGLASAAGLPVTALDEEEAELRFESAAALSPDELPPRPDLKPDGDALCYIIYTSGSTGRPKGVPIGHAQVVNFVRVAAEGYGFRDTDRVYQGLTLAFDFAVEEIWVPLTVGATLVPNTSGGGLLGSDLADFLRTREITALCCVPTLLATLDDELPLVRLLIVSGEACPRDLVQRWHRPGRSFLNAYGPTEATVTATLGRPQPGRPVTIGRPLPTYAIVILPPGECRALPFGEEGEIAIAGIGVAEGYLNRPEQTQAAFIPDAIGIPHNRSGRIYRTGDLGRINADGEVEYLGRIDTQVKIRGYRIELAEIESVLMECPGVAQAVVNPWEASPGVKELVAYYTAADPAAPPAAEDLARTLRERLPPYMVPAWFERLQAMPMLASDKADRKALPPPSAARLDRSAAADHVPPAPGLEQLLAGALAEVLGLPKVSATAHFFEELGLSSLLLARLITLLRRDIEPEAVTMRVLYGQPSVRALASAIEAWRAEQAAAMLGAVLAGAGRGAADVGGASGGGMGGTGGGGSGPGRRPGSPSWPDLPVHRASDAAYLACGLAQVLLGVLWIGGHAAAWWYGLHHVIEAPTWAGAWARAAGFAVLYTGVCALLPIGLKWLLVGREQPQRFPAWGWRYLRFWTVRLLVRSNPLALLAGTPLYATYLRALGARVDPSALVAMKSPPACPDLLSVGAGAVIGHHAMLPCYRVVRGWVETGTVSIGAGAVVGEFAYLDIDTGIGEGGELRHASSLQRGQQVPAGACWHGSPGQPAGGARPGATLPDAAGLPEVTAWRRWRYALVQLALAWALVLPLPSLLAFALWGESGHALDAAGSTIAGLAQEAAALAEGPPALAGTAADSGAVAGWLRWLGLTLGLGLLALLLGLAWVAAVPRLVAPWLRPGERYPLYGFRHWLLRFVQQTTNVRFFNTLFGDSGDIVHYLRAIGWRFPALRQTGSNLGLAQQHDLPTHCTLGSGTMVSDGLTMLNASWGPRGFQVGESSLAAGCFLGNAIVVPTAHQVGRNCLLASKVMLPIDGPLREDQGLLGSPPMVIPRHSALGGDPTQGRPPGWLQARLAGKRRHNRAVMVLYLLSHALPLGATAIAWHALYPWASAHEHLFAAAFAVATLVASFLWMALVDAASRGFRPLQPDQGSIYEPAFWQMERHWKLGLAQDNPLLAALAGTPLRGWAWRLMGVSVGRRLFDDGCAITEKTLVSIGDDCTLSAQSTLQGHSLEDGNFRSERLWLGDAVSVGSHTYVHYETRLEDGAVVMHDAFVMKGARVAAGEVWAGNPADCVGQVQPSARPVPRGGAVAAPQAEGQAARSGAGPEPAIASVALLPERRPF